MRTLSAPNLTLLLAGGVTVIAGLILIAEGMYYNVAVALLLLGGVVPAFLLKRDDTLRYLTCCFALAGFGGLLYYFGLWGNCMTFDDTKHCPALGRYAPIGATAICLGLYTGAAAFLFIATRKLRRA